MLKNDNDIYKKIIKRMEKVYFNAWISLFDGTNTKLSKFIKTVEHEVKGEDIKLGSLYSESEKLQKEYYEWLRNELADCMSMVGLHSRLGGANIEFIKENKPLIEEICSLSSAIQTYIDKIAIPLREKVKTI